MAMTTPEEQPEGEAQEAEVEIADEDPVAQEPMPGGATRRLKQRENFCACSLTGVTAQTPRSAIWYTLVAEEWVKAPLVDMPTPLRIMCSMEDDWFSTIWCGSRWQQ